jgi:hypothetical protein
MFEVCASAGYNAESHVYAFGAMVGEDGFPDLIALFWVEECFAEIVLLAWDEG